MADLLFVVALVAPPVVVLVSFALLMLPTRQGQRELRQSRIPAH